MIHLYGLSRVIIFIETEGRMGVARGWGRGNGEYCLMGTELPVLQDEKRSGNWVHSNVSGPNIQNCTLRNGYDDTFYVVCILLHF